MLLVSHMLTGSRKSNAIKSTNGTESVTDSITADTMRSAAATVTERSGQLLAIRE